MMEALADQVAVVTGAANGIGAGIAGVLAAEGARVAILDVDQDAAENAARRFRAKGYDAIGVYADVTDAVKLKSAVNVVTARWGRVDILAANAGIYPQIPLADITPAQWGGVIDINLRGALFSIQAVLPAMRGASYGRIVLT